MRIVAISGSLRAHSSNAALLRAAAAVAPAGVELDLYEELGTLPLFNPDLDEEGMTPPASVAALRAVQPRVRARHARRAQERALLAAITRRR